MQRLRIVAEPADPGVPAAMRGKVALSAAHGGNGEGLPCDTTAHVWHRARDVAALAALVVLLATLWVGIFFSSTRLWGEYRPNAAERQEPPPRATILVPRLTLEEAREVVEHAAAQAEGSYGGR